MELQIYVEIYLIFLKAGIICILYQKSKDALHNAQ